MTVTIIEKCSICLDNIEQDDVLGVSHTCCGHTFHTVCLQRHMGQIVIDAKLKDQQLFIKEDHPGFHCPNCRERLHVLNTTSRGSWYSSPPSQVAFDALFLMYNQRHKTKDTGGDTDRHDEKFRFAQITTEKARNTSCFVNILRAQQAAQRKFSSVDRKNEGEVYRAYKQLSLTTAQMLDLYLQCSGWSKEHYKPLLESQMKNYGLDVRALESIYDRSRLQ